MKFSYLKVYEKRKVIKDLYSIHLNDSFENILERLVFYDEDSNLITEIMDESKKKRYLKEIKADYYYFKDSYNRADYQVNFKNSTMQNIPNIIIKKIKETEFKC